MASTGRTDGPDAVARGAGERELRRERSAAVARTEDLVHKLTALADRYDALPVAQQPLRDWERSESIKLMRSAAASGRGLLDAWASSALAQPERSPAATDAQAAGAQARDVAAARRDEAAELRDQHASRRDRRARAVRADLDRGFPDRFLSANDRDDAAGDRTAALDDRASARRDREQSSSEVHAAQDRPDPRLLLEQLSAKTTFYQAQGLLMDRSGMDAAEAFEALLLEAQQQGTSMTEVATRLVRELSTTSTSQLPGALRPES